MIAARENHAREELTILVLIEPSAFESEQRNAGEVPERERVDRELCERLVGGGVGFVIEDVNGAIPDLKEVDVASDHALIAGILRNERNSPPRFERCDVLFAEPYRNFAGDRDRSVRQHEALQRLMTRLVVADGRDDKRRGGGRCVFSDVDDRAGGVGECRRSLRSAGCGVPFPAEEVVWAVGRHAFEKIGERCLLQFLGV